MALVHRDTPAERDRGQKLLTEASDVFLSPHSGAATEEAEAHLLEVVGDNLLHVLDGEPPINVVNQVLAARR